ncbi:hypothetical protein Bca4012_034369 [Brassica carinata]
MKNKQFSKVTRERMENNEESLNRSSDMDMAYISVSERTGDFISDIQTCENPAA